MSYAIEYQFANALDTEPRRYHLRSRLPRADEYQFRRGVDVATALTRQRNFYIDPTAFGGDLLRLRLPTDDDAAPEWLAVEVAAQVSRGGEETANPLHAALLHLLTHQMHHRGQVHDMLAQTDVAPPQLDEFFLAEDLSRRARELRDLGLT